MRLTSLFSVTLREAPTGAEVASHQLLLRAGFIRPLGQGMFVHLPLARRTIAKIERILRKEMNVIGGQEVALPIVQPAELCRATPERVRFKDRKEHDWALATGYTEAIVEMIKSEIRSHRQLPQIVYHIQTRFMDDPRPRAGLIRAREFTALDAFALDADSAGLDKRYRALCDAFHWVFRRSALPVVAVSADVGDTVAHRFVYPTSEGEDEIISCKACGYIADRRTATFRKVTADAEPARPIEKVATPDAKTIAALARFLELPTRKTAKAVFLVASHDDVEGRRSRLVFIVIRGDMEVNEAKLAAAIGATELRPANDDEIRAIGAEPGYASPIGLATETAGRSSPPIIIVVDDAVPTSPNLVAGANEHGYHLLNTNYGRDYTAHIVADIALAGEGAACPQCGAPLRIERCIEVGRIVQLGARYAEAAGATYLAADGAPRPVMMVAASIGVSRLLACIAEAHHDNRGLILPASIAPYHVHLVALAGRDGDASAIAEAFYHALQRAGVEVLFDDRTESPGVKFADADLIGLPLRITVAPKSLAAGGVEFKRRDAEAKEIVPLDAAVERARALLNQLAAEVETVAWRAQTNAE